jgi:hypothetical protein
MSLVVDTSANITTLRTFYVTEAKSNKTFKNMLRNDSEKKVIIKMKIN